MPISTDPAAEVISEFERELALTLARVPDIVLALAGAIENSGDTSDEFFWEQIDALKGDLGSRAANSCSDDEQEQEAAISDAENWVANNISNAHHETWVAAVLTLHGVEEGEQIVRNHLIQTSSPHPPAP